METNSASEPTETTVNGRTINDRRDQTLPSWGFVVATDKFMSGWGGAAKGRSLYAISVENAKEADTVFASFKRRSEMKYVRIVRDIYRVKKAMRRGDHLSIADKTTADRFFEANGFGEK